jgi:hypothetical protein
MVALVACTAAPSVNLLQPPSSPPPGGAPAVAGQPCPAWVHEAYTVVAADGKRYPTWHPATDPASGCLFDHEHGDDPRTSLADPSLPAFGYAAAQGGMSEAHAGFKVFVVNRGTRNDEGRVARVSTRAVAHMGTGGVRRFTERHHSLEFDLVAPDGHELHVQGIADTGLGGSICQRDASLGDNDPHNDIGRTFGLVRGAGCDSTYEIWTFKLHLHDRLEVVLSTAAFDPVTVLNPTDPNKPVRLETEYDRPGARGCDRESYHGPVYWYNATGSTLFFTDAMGMPSQALAPGALEQFVSNHADIGIPMSDDQTQFKLRSAHCAPGLGFGN